MKERELRKTANCVLCEKPFGHTGIPVFWRVKVERLGVDMKALRRQDGLATLIGNPMIAQVMGPDEEMTTLLGKAEVTVCESCATNPGDPLTLLRLLARGECSGHDKS